MMSRGISSPYLLLAMYILVCRPQAGMFAAEAQDSEDKKVTIEVVGVYRDADWKFVRDELKQLLGETKTTSYIASGNRFNIKASPIDDIEAIAKAIQFGTKVKLDGRHIRVTCDEAKQVPGPAKESTKGQLS